MLTNILLCVLAVWHAEVVPGATECVSLGIDPQGSASVVYWDDENIYYSQRQQSGTLSFWLEEYVNSAWDPNYDYHDNFCVDKNSTPHLIFFRPPSTNDTPERFIYYVTKDSTGQWTCTYICNEFLYLEMIDLAIDTMAYPHVIVHKFYHYYDGTSWHAETLNITHEYVLPSLAVDCNDTVHLSISGFPGNAFAGYGRKDGGSWHYEYDYTYPVSSPINIRTDNAGNPHVLFALSTDSSLYYGVKENDEWMYEDITDLNAYFIDVHEDTVHICAAFGNSTRHYWKQGSTWLYEDVHTGEPEDFAVDSDGYVHCLVYENYQIKYVTNRPQTAVYEETAEPIHASVLSMVVQFPVKISLADLGYPDEVEIIDITGRRITGMCRCSNQETFMWDGHDLQHRSSTKGIYFVKAKKGDIQTLIKLIIID